MKITSIPNGEVVARFGYHDRRLLIQSLEGCQPLILQQDRLYGAWADAARQQWLRRQHHGTIPEDLAVPSAYADIPGNRLGSVVLQLSSLVTEFARYDVARMEEWLDLEADWNLPEVEHPLGAAETSVYQP